MFGVQDSPREVESMLLIVPLKKYIDMFGDQVGPRKKFKCSTPSCENVGMLSSAAGFFS